MLFFSRTPLSHWKYGLYIQYPKFYSDIKHSKDQSKEVSPYGHIDALKSNSISGWAKTSFHEFAENMIILRFEHLLEKTTHMEEMRKSKAHVFGIQKKMLEVGEKKRHMMKELDVIRNNLNHIYRDINIDRIKKIHIDLASKEIEDLCKSEKHLCDAYKQVDKEEQSLQTESYIAINEAYEKEKNHSNFIKVVSVVGTIISSILTLIVSTVIHSQRQKSLENKISQLLGEKNPESWGSYLKRNTRWVYSWTSKFR